MQRIIRSSTQSWPLDLGLIALIPAESIQVHTGSDGEHGGLEVPEGIEKECETMEIWGSCVNPFTGERSEEPTIWALLFKNGNTLVHGSIRPDPELPEGHEPYVPAEE